MPELPEVEVARRNLARWLVGTTIREAWVATSRVIRPDSPTKLRTGLVGHKVKLVERRGKWLRIALDGDVSIFGHLGMSGRWIERDVDDAKVPHERVTLLVSKAARSKPRSIRYVDPRMFGRVLLRADAGPPEGWTALGPDALTVGLDAGHLVKRLGVIKRSIKETMLDQSLFAGVGNIQATETLWRAKLDPRRAAKTITAVEMRRLITSLEASLKETLAREEGPEITYVEDAGAPNPFTIYGKAGTPCPRCRASLVRIVQGARATTFCAACQT